MSIPRIDLLIFGYRIVTVQESERKELLNLLLKLKISVKFEKESFLISERDFKKIVPHISGKNCCSVSEPMGLSGFFKKIKKRYGIFSALLVSLFLFIFSSTHVFDIRIEGSAAGNEEKILEELETLGFKPGVSFAKVDKARIESEMLSSSENVSWININQRGNVFYVKVIDKINHDEEEIKTGYANVVALRDGIIEEITVKSGFPTVKPGDTVKKGEILISGVIPHELGGGFCYADGTVIARYSDEYSVKMPGKEVLKEEKEREISKIKINFFDFSFKILEKYRKTELECDIIKEKRKFVKFFNAKLPISFEREYQVFYENYERSYTEDEMIRIASSRMREGLISELKDKNLLKLRTYGAFSEGNYVLTTEYVASSEIGETFKFDFLHTSKGD